MPDYDERMFADQCLCYFCPCSFMLLEHSNNNENDSTNVPFFFLPCTCACDVLNILFLTLPVRLTLCVLRR